MKTLIQSAFKITTTGGRILYQAVLKTLQDEIKLSQEAARLRSSHKDNTVKSKLMSLNEAKLILNVDSLNRDEIERRSKYLFDANKKSGSLYLLSKVVRAKERLCQEMNIKKLE